MNQGILNLLKGVRSWIDSKIDDDSVSEDKLWSSSKISAELQSIRNEINSANSDLEDIINN